ncbi:MAG TPA: replication initiation factor domain-containing protein [Burkholderiaceae bacterium]|nr:replication initiation factor domain-containing protein [Burkholderiaceae bacterium]
MLGFELGEARKGRDHYDHTWTINSPFGKDVASVSGGGASQRDTFCVTLKGEACTFARPGWEQRLHDIFLPLYHRVTRIDLARDFFNGECTIDDVVHCYNNGEFDYRNRRPSHQEHGVWIGEAPHSRTFQVSAVQPAR